ncbi:hypothetical protein vBEliSR6L_105 [Erythrobacter phage vB_EliS_R6L]|nr:hypothetical protein vBEliSR6L_105 [Erythrobacter phage vB_EliS_R6L]
MTKKSAATVREEQELAEQISKAHAFSAFLLFGPRDRRKVMIEQGGPEGYAAAVKAADDLNAQARADGSTRSAIIYAINRLGSFDVTPDAAKRAGLI